MKSGSVLVLVLGLVCAAHADLTLVGEPAVEIGVEDQLTIPVASDAPGTYRAWVEIEDPEIANFYGEPEFTPAGDPGGSSTVSFWPNYGAWYQVSVLSFPPAAGIAPGEHVLVNLIGISEGLTYLNLYANDGNTLLDQVAITVVPEPLTLALLGLGGLFVYRRR